MEATTLLIHRFGCLSNGWVPGFVLHPTCGKWPRYDIGNDADPYNRDLSLFSYGSARINLPGVEGNFGSKGSEM